MGRRAEWRTFLAFFLADPPAGWDGRSVVDPASPEPARVGVVEWLRCRAAILGGPNDEALHGHRLWRRGLDVVGAYAASEVVGSGWIAAMEEADRVHAQHRPEAFATCAASSSASTTRRSSASPTGSARSASSRRCPT